MNRKFFFFDIDGTLTIKETGQIVPSALIAIDKLKANGHFVAIATGRAAYKAIPMLDVCHIDHMVCNGGAGIVINKQLVENKPLEKEKAVLICKEAEALGYGVLIAFENSIKVAYRNDLFRQQVGERHEPTIYEYTDKAFEDFEAIYKIYISIPKEKEHELTTKNLLGHMRFHEDYLMYQHDIKDLGIKRILELCDGKDEDVVVFGDDTNDFAMFKDEWFKVAMGNACDALKEKADFVTKKNSEDGILYACEKNKWI